MFQDAVTRDYMLKDATGEILIMLAVAFLLGWLLSRLFSCSSCRGNMFGIDGGDAHLHAVAPVELNDLKVVEGIGPKIEQLLHAGGITTWAELAATNEERVKKILDDAGPRFKMHNPATWMEQAGMARDGKWAELKEYQDFLDGGR